MNRGSSQRTQNNKRVQTAQWYSVVQMVGDRESKPTDVCRLQQASSIILGVILMMFLSRSF